MGKNRVQRKQKEKDKPKKDNIYSKKHVRITLMKQEKKFNLTNKIPSNNFK
tara:strand:+ start:425 stop:577 length:153 start_codon:yes stop_codon:yes gene_type:complete